MPVKKVLLLRAVSMLCGLALAACGGSKAVAPVGVSIGVTLSSPSGTTLVQQGTTIEIDAQTPGDTSGKGVTWTLVPATGAGTLTSSTTTAAMFQAPATVAGALFATLTATSITDATKYAQVTLTVNGSPTIAQPVLFPADLNVAYATYISVAGGVAPYTWSFTGTLPPGLALDGSATSTVGITGVPNTLGSFTFTLTTKDSTGASASATVTQVINPASACLLQGRFGYLFTGFRNGLPVTRGGSFNVDGSGNVTGIFDYKDSGVGHAATAVTAGTCTTSTANRGVFTSGSAAGNESFDYAVTSSLLAGQLEQDDGSGIIGSGQFFQQDATAFTQAALAGDWVFALIGDDGAKRRLGLVGRLTLDATGVISNGVADDNAATPLANVALTGSLTAPDTNGRGTATLAVGSLSLPVAYYVINSNTVYVVSADLTLTTPRLAGRMTRQTGAGTIGSAALASPAVLSLWGSSYSGGLPVASMSAGLLSGAVPASGTINLLLDVTDRGTSVVNTYYPAVPYAITANGRGSLSFGSGTAARNFVVYADGAGGGYLLEPASPVGNFGILDLQQGAPYTVFPIASYVGGTLYAGATSPITLAPQLQFSNGSIGGNLTGTYALDGATGRAIAAVTRTILGGTGLVIYVVSPQKLVILGDGINVPNTSLSWFSLF